MFSLFTQSFTSIQEDMARVHHVQGFTRLLHLMIVVLYVITALRIYFLASSHWVHKSNTDMSVLSTKLLGTRVIAVDKPVTFGILVIFLHPQLCGCSSRIKQRAGPARTHLQAKIKLVPFRLRCSDCLNQHQCCISERFQLAEIYLKTDFICCFL